MYKIASDKRQASLYRGKQSDWINGEERLSADDKLRQMQQGIKLLEARVLAATGEERKRLGREKMALQDEIKALRAVMPKSPVEWKAHFVNEAKRILSESQFQMIFNAANISAERETRKREKNGEAECPGL